MFGERFKEMESVVMLDDGIYIARIKGVQLKDGTFGNYLLVEVDIKDHSGCSPRNFILNDSPKTNSSKYSQQELHEMWCKSMTKFFRNFQIQPGNFNINQWIGKIGKITVRPQKNNPELKEIVPYEMKLKPRTEQNQNQNQNQNFVQNQQNFGNSYPQQVQQPQAQYQNQNLQSGFSEMGNSGNQSQNFINEFPEDTPF